MSPDGRMVIVPGYRAEGWGTISVKVETSGSVSVNHSLTGSRCKNGTSKWWEDRFHCAVPVQDDLKGFR